MIAVARFASNIDTMSSRHRGRGARFLSPGTALSQAILCIFGTFAFFSRRGGCERKRHPAHAFRACTFLLHDFVIYMLQAGAWCPDHTVGFSKRSKDAFVAISLFFLSSYSYSPCVDAHTALDRLTTLTRTESLFLSQRVGCATKFHPLLLAYRLFAEFEDSSCGQRKTRTTRPPPTKFTHRPLPNSRTALRTPRAILSPEPRAASHTSRKTTRGSARRPAHARAIFSLPPFSAFDPKRKKKHFLARR